MNRSPNYHAHVEQLTDCVRVGCLRVFADDAVAGRDPYVMAATAIWYSPEQCELLGTTSLGVPFAAMRGAVCEEMRRLETEQVVWDRIRRGRDPRRVRLITGFST